MNRSRVRLARSGLSSQRRGRRPVPERLEERSLLSTFTVINTDDSGPGSLRQAILGANALAGLDTIDFDFPRAGRYTIMPLSGLPSIDDPVTIDGTTQPGYAGIPFIELDGSQAATEVGLSLSGGSTVRGLVINRFALGILLSGGAGNHVEGNYIGTDLTGNQAAGNLQNGILIVSSSDNMIGGTSAAARNVIAGNGRGGIEINGTGNTIEGNYIGLGADGATALGNNGNGIHLNGPQNTIGGTAPGAGNVISGNALNGIHDEDGSGIIIQGNFIGTDATGLIAVGNHGDGVKTEPGADVIGGTDPGAGNLISGNGQAGIEMISSLVEGNKIGTSIDGELALGNAGPGILDHGFSTLIGGSVKRSGNLISGNGGDGIVLEADDNTVIGNQIGVAADGITALGNAGSGVEVQGQGNIIGGRVALEGNLISGNAVHVVFLSRGGSSDNLIRGNRIGTDADGNAALGNGMSGIWIEGADNVIGGPLTGDGNLISGNGPRHLGSGVIAGGVVISGGFATGNILQGNEIGTDATGSRLALGNLIAGVFIVDASNNLVGGTQRGAGNLISGQSSGSGIQLQGGGTGNRIEGNLIGTDRSGRAAVGNFVGVEIEAVGDTIGGTVAGAGNVVSGNRFGIFIVGLSFEGDTGFAADHILVQGNLIGTQIDGHSPLGNTNAGVSITDSDNNTIGAAVDSGMTPSSAVSAGNTIAFNQTGVSGDVLRYPNTVLGNSIYSNTGLGIEMYPAGVTPNDDDANPDGFGNGSQNYPVLSSASLFGGNTTVRGTLNSTPNDTFRVEFFANDTPDETRYGEGQTYLGAVTVTTGADGNADISAMLGNAVSGQFISATATRPGYNTSEFSRVVQVNPPNTAADLSVTVTSAPDPVVLGQHLIYTLTVTNHGPDPATNVGLIDLLPRTLTQSDFRSASGGGRLGTVNFGYSVTFALGTLASGASVTNTIDVVNSRTPNLTNTPGTVNDSASVTADEPDPNPADDTASVSTLVNPAPSDLAVTVTATPDPVAEGGDLTYTITASKLNGTILGTGVVVTDTLPPGVTFVSASSGGTFSGGVVTYPVGNLPFGVPRTLILVVRADVAGPITNAVTITTANQPDPDLSNNTATNTATVTAPPSGSGITATTNPNDQVAPQRGGSSGTTQSFSLTFSTALDPARAVDLRNYHLFAKGGAGVFGVSTGREVLLRSARYNPTTHVVTLTPRRAIPSGLYFEVKVDGTSRHGVSDLSGLLIDGNGDGRPGGDYVAILARGRSLRYRERDGDLVGLRLNGGGVLELHQRADGTVQQVRIVGAAPGRSELHGIVLRFRRGGDGKTTIGAVTGLGGVRNLLTSARFLVG
jgi:uncharacterized repeat protein (TIGR01451 family)